MKKSVKIPVNTVKTFLKYYTVIPRQCSRLNLMKRVTQGIDGVHVHVKGKYYNKKEKDWNSVWLSTDQCPHHNFTTVFCDETYGDPIILSCAKARWPGINTRSHIINKMALSPGSG